MWSKKSFIFSYLTQLTIHFKTHEMFHFYFIKVMLNASESREHGVVLLFRVSGWIHAPVDASCLIRLQGSIFKVCSKPFLSATWFSAKQTEEQRGCSRYFCYFLDDYIFFRYFFPLELLMLQWSFFSNVKKGHHSPNV